MLAKRIAALPPLILLACLEIVAAQHRAEAAAKPADTNDDSEDVPVVAAQTPFVAANGAGMGGNHRRPHCVF